MKDFKDPPEVLRAVIESVQVLFGHEPDWTAAGKMLEEAKFLEKLVNYDKDRINAQTLKKLTKLTNMPSFNPANLNNLSLAAGALCKWVKALY